MLTKVSPRFVRVAILLVATMLWCGPVFAQTVTVIRTVNLRPEQSTGSMRRTPGKRVPTTAPVPRQLTNDQKRQARKARLQCEFALLPTGARGLKRAKTIMGELIEIDRVEARKGR